MIFNTVLIRNGLRRAAVTSTSLTRYQSARAQSTVPATLIQRWYSIFGSSTIGYASWLAMGIVVSELVTGWGVDSAWNSVNKGRTYDSVDWSKFKTDDDEDDEDDDDDEDDEEEGDDEEEDDE